MWCIPALRRNLDRLFRVLGELDAVFRVQRDRGIRPELPHPAGSGGGH